MDLSDFYMSVEWDILEVPAVRNERYYTCCDGKITNILVSMCANCVLNCRAISRHHIQHNDATKNAFLYSKLDNSLHGDFFPHSSCLLPSVRLWGESKPSFFCVLSFCLFFKSCFCKSFIS